MIIRSISAHVKGGSEACARGVITIPKAAKLEHVKDNIGAVDWRLARVSLVLMWNFVGPYVIFKIANK